MEKESYIYRNCPIPGGGYVTGFVFHEKNPSVLYIRTDIGGVYGYDNRADRWYSLADHVTMDDLSETYPIAIALDPVDADYLYFACGIRDASRGTFAVSHDRGLSFRYFNLPMPVHGNYGGRGTGYRLIVDRTDRSTLYYASQMSGLWVSYNRGEYWERMDSFPEDYCTFVGMSPDGRLMYAAGAGVTTAVSEHLRGHSLYISKDHGATFEPLAGPEDHEIDGVPMAGHVAQRYSYDDKYLYVTYAVQGRNSWIKELGYSCDGGSVTGGRVYRYAWDTLKAEDITPAGAVTSGEPASAPGDTADLGYGFGGISAGTQVRGLLVTSTICSPDGDRIYRSTDYGSTWECILHGLDTGRMVYRTSYMRPEYNGGGNLIHWLSDIKIDPHNNHEAWFNTGTGVFKTEDIQAQTVTFHDSCAGIEETVHLNVYAPPAGDTILIDILGDLGGFAFTDLDKQCDNSFSDERGNRYITCINADYSDIYPETVVVTPRGNWTGETRGGLILSRDACRTFTRLHLPYGIADELDAAFRRIEQPNVNSGWVAMSPDTMHIVWSVADGIRLPVTRVLVSHDQGESFEPVTVCGTEGEHVTDDDLKVFSDRVDSKLFYGFGRDSRIYVSTDSGETFTRIQTPESFPSVDFGLIDCADKTEIRGDSGSRGIFYVAAGAHGLWKLTFDIENMRLHVYRLTEQSDAVYRIGLGLGAPGADYMRDPKAIYMAGIIAGTYGFYRTVDECGSYVRLNDRYHMFGDINSIEGDPRVYGRFYIATGSRGVIYGVPDTEDDD